MTIRECFPEEAPLKPEPRWAQPGHRRGSSQRREARHHTQRRGARLGRRAAGRGTRPRQPPRAGPGPVLPPHRRATAQSGPGRSPASRLLRRTEAPLSRVQGPSQKRGLHAKCGSFLHPQKKAPFAKNRTDPTLCGQEPPRRPRSVTPGRGAEDAAEGGRDRGRLGRRGPEGSDLCIRNRDEKELWGGGGGI